MTSKAAGKEPNVQGFPRRTLLWAAGIVVLHIVIAYVLDAAGLIESLLSPSGARLLWILPLAMLLYALRLTVYFIIPGVVVGSILEWLTIGARRSKS